MKQKYSIFFILIFINLGAAFAQKKEVVWQGYIVESESADVSDNEKFHNDDFMKAIMELDKNNGFFVFIPGYDPDIHVTPDCPYQITGTLKQYKGSIYDIETKLQIVNNGKKNVFSNPEREDIYKILLRTIIQKQAKSIYNSLIYDIDLEKKENLQQPLIDFDKEYMKKIDSINIEEFYKALQQLSIMESRFGKSEEINNRRRRIEYSAIAVPLSVAEEKIALAFDLRIPNDSSESFCKEAEIFTSQVRQIIGQSKDSSFNLRLEKVESKIREYQEKAQFAVYTGGLGLFIEKPLPVMISGPDIDFQKVYPGILGLNIRYVGPLSLPLLWYFQFSYMGINGSMKEISVAYLTEAAIHAFSVSTGMHLQFYINRKFAPYGYFGAGYTHLIEYASDGYDSVSLNFPGMVMDVGLGTRFHLTSNLALEAKTQWNLMLYQSMMMAVNFSLGGSYLFHGREFITRR